MKRLFVVVFAVTVAILSFLAVAGGVWWHYENQSPNLIVEFDGFSSPKFEGASYWGLNFTIENGDSTDYVPGDWELFFIDSNGAISPSKLTIWPTIDSKLFAKEKTGVDFRTNYPLESDLFTPTIDMELSGSRADAESYMANLERFKKSWKVLDLLLVNDSLDLKFKVSLSDFYETELIRRQRILARQGDPVDDPIYRAELESTQFCDDVDDYPCRRGNMIIQSVSSAPDSFSSEEHKERLMSLPECSDGGEHPCKIGEYILEQVQD